jgi:hypothetical protein
MLRNVVERIFRVLKCRFQIFLRASDFSFAVQVKLVYAATALHNFLDWNENGGGHCGGEDMGDASEGSSGITHADTGAESQELSALRNDIAQKMWEDYERHQARAM